MDLHPPPSEKGLAVITPDFESNPSSSASETGRAVRAAVQPPDQSSLVSKRTGVVLPSASFRPEQIDAVPNSEAVASKLVDSPGKPLPELTDRWGTDEGTDDVVLHDGREWERRPNAAPEAFRTGVLGQRPQGSQSSPESRPAHTTSGRSRPGAEPRSHHSRGERHDDGIRQYDEAQHLTDQRAWSDTGGSGLQDQRLLAIETPLGPDRLLLVGIDGHEEVSELFHYALELLSTDFAIAAKDMVGKPVTFSVHLADEGRRYFHGIVREFSAGLPARAGMYRRYRAEVVPWLWFLTRTTDCRIFQRMSVPDIIKKVFEIHGMRDYDLGQIRGIYPRRTYCVQYRESAFNFISRLMEDEGIFYFFRHEPGKHTMVLTDSNLAYPSLPEGTVLYQHAASFHPHEDRITQWEHQYAFRSGKWALNDYNFETPQARLLSGENTLVDLPKNKDFEFYDYPGNYEEPDDGRRLARIRMEEEESGYDLVEGESACRSFSPGFKFTFDDYAVESENGKTYALVSVEHHATEPASYGSNSEPSEEGAIYRNRFRAVPESVRYRPARKTRKPLVEGPQTAVVVGPPGEEIYPDEYGRVKVQFHWDRLGQRDQDSSCWIRVSQMHAGKGWGYTDLPRIGEEVIVDFLEGDPDRPIITGRVYNADNMPPFALPAGKTRRGNTTNTYQGAGYNEMSMDDTPGAEQIRIHGQYNMDTVVGNNQTLKVNVDRTTQIGNNDVREVGGSSLEHVAVDKRVTVDGNIDISAGSNIVIRAGTSITFLCGSAMIHMNQAGVISISGTLVSVAGMILTSVAAPITLVSGAFLLNTGGMTVNTGAYTNTILGGADVTIEGGKVQINP